MWKRRRGQQEIDRRKTHVEVVVEFGETGVKAFSNFLALERSGRSVNCDLSHGATNIECTFLAPERRRGGHELLHFSCDEGDVGFEGIRGETKLDELRETQ